jgi:glycine/D-amino acid oxidase-like deaminating enzyme
VTLAQSGDHATADVVVVGGGLVGSAVAWGLAEIGTSVLVLDEGDVAFRASRGNFGLVWVQGKGATMPAYADWTRASADRWPAFAERLGDELGRDVGYRKPGGLHLCLSETDLEARSALIHRMHNSPGAGGDDCRMICAEEVRELLPDAGPDVLGASYCAHDGHTSPLLLLRALHEGIVRRGGRILPEHPVAHLTPERGGFAIEAGGRRFSCGKVVLAAGLANRWLGPMVGLDVPVAPQKGQILVTSRLAPRFDVPTTHVRQTAEGHLMLGDSKEDAGFDVSSSVPVMGEIASRATRAFPFLKDVEVVRAWGALRIMTPDGHPVYDESPACPGAFAVSCHSGVTLAAQHALALAPLVARGGFADALAPFTARRFAHAAA